MSHWDYRSIISTNLREAQHVHVEKAGVLDVDTVCTAIAIKELHGGVYERGAFQQGGAEVFRSRLGCGLRATAYSVFNVCIYTNCKFAVCFSFGSLTICNVCYQPLYVYCTILSTNK